MQRSPPRIEFLPISCAGLLKNADQVIQRADISSRPPSPRLFVLLHQLWVCPCSALGQRATDHIGNGLLVPIADMTRHRTRLAGRDRPAVDASHCRDAAKRSGDERLVSAVDLRECEVDFAYDAAVRAIELRNLAARDAFEVIAAG